MAFYTGLIVGLIGGGIIGIALGIFGMIKYVDIVTYELPADLHSAINEHLTLGDK